MANITVKKNDGTTDVVYTQQVPSGGDRSPAIWRNLTVGSAPGHNPELKSTSRPNGTGSARRVEMTFKYPYTVTGADGKIQISDTFLLEVSAVVPQGMPTADINEAASQGSNLIGATLTKDVLNSGFAPT
jgi:hypothetical protein